MGFLDGYTTYDPEIDGYGNPGQWRRSFYKKMSSDEAQAILNEDDPYEILGIKRTSTLAEIKIAFYREAKKWHPDKNPTLLEKATAMMKKLNATYQMIK